MAELRENIVGIDLGTTLSAIAYLDSHGKATTLSNSDGEPLTPSAVYLQGGSAVVGRAAKEAAATSPDNVAMYFKREMGRSHFSRPVDGRPMRPETLSAILLRKLKLDAEKRVGPVDKAVITVPAFFDDARRKATEDAGTIAGLTVLSIINEPTAAALAYSLDGQVSNSGQARADFPGGQLTALVYDLGGGTFDVTVVRLASKRFDTLATDGEVQLGGKDFDQRIVDFVAAEFTKRHGINPAEDGQRCWGLLNEAELAKKLLSKLPVAQVKCFYRDKMVETMLSRDQFESFCGGLLSRTELVTDLVVREQAKLGWAGIDRVLLVGGSTRMPMVKKMLRNLTGKEPDDSLDPDQVVAHGAVIFAAIDLAQSGEADLLLDEEWRDQLQEMVVHDVNAHSLGISAYDEKQSRHLNAILLPKNTQLPFARSRVFRTNRANASSIKVKVLEGDAQDAGANIQLGECRISDLGANLPVRSPIQVRLSYERNGRVNVAALDMTSGQLATAVIHRQGGMSADDIAREAEFVQSLEIH